MSILLCIKIPKDIAKMLHEVDAPGEKEDLSDAHITLTHTKESDASTEVLGDMIEVLVPLLQGVRPFAAHTSRVSVFDATSHSDDKIPLVCRVESPELHSMRQKVAEAFDKAGIVFSKDFPDYKPHITLSYAPNEESVKKEWSDKTIPMVSFGVNALTLFYGWGGELTEVTIPLHLGKVASRNLSVVRRFLGRRVG